MKDSNRVYAVKSVGVADKEKLVKEYEDFSDAFLKVEELNNLYRSNNWNHKVFYCEEVKKVK